MSKINIERETSILTIKIERKKFNRNIKNWIKSDKCKNASDNFFCLVKPIKDINKLVILKKLFCDVSKIKLKLRVK